MKVGDSKRLSKFGMGINVNDNVATPSYLLEDLRKEFGELFDPCPLNANPTVDGLEMEEWGSKGEACYVNPPFSNIKPWVEKAIEEAAKGKQIIMMLPVRTNSAYWHRFIFPYADEIRFLDKYIQFEGFGKTCPFSICLVVFRSARRKLNPVVKNHPRSLIRKKTKANYQHFIWQRQQTEPPSPSRSLRERPEPTSIDSHTKSTE